MVKKMKFLSSSSWAWQSCHHQPKTLSFRANNTNDVVLKTTNSTSVDAATTPTTEILESPVSLFTESASFSTASDEDIGDPIESVIRGLRSDRLFFEPEDTSSLLKSKLTASSSDDDDDDDGSGTTSFLRPFKHTVVLSMDSRNPYVDFRKSMEEMVDAHGINDWERLEELLSWYLNVNVKSNHGYIVAAFVDLFASAASTSSSSSSSSSSLVSPNSSPLSVYTSSCSTPCGGLRLEQIKEEITREDYAAASSSSKQPN